ncbi:hypothetical protein AC529_15595 [Thermobifida cellulosilytica TB100]|uniref:Uncharacterized protein n=1 Tax=Thermobifida cellulosilytica TB100 TaxID=665004 RepID=A0A147KER0_THECS|nr:hypothetical protein AC529_15595 [Thermobifida cellulosilytica TB100]
MIDPDKISIPNADPDAIEAVGKALKDDGSDIGQAGADIKAAWSGLEGNYIAPESEELLAAVNPVADDADAMETNIRTVGQALVDFAAEIRPILERWRSLKADAVTLANRIRGDDDWRKDEDTVEEHNQLNDDLLAVQNEYMAAERECANKITALFGGTRFVAANPDGSTTVRDGEQLYGFTEAPTGIETPWATPQEYDAPWWEDVWDGIADFGVGIAQDLAGMVGLYSEEGGWGVSSWSEWGSNLGEYWGGTLEGLGSLVGLYGENGWGVGSFGEWWGNFSTGWTEFAHAIVPWREWGDRPGYVITQTVLNIGSMFVGGSGVVKALAQGARRVGGRGPDAPDVDAPSLSRVDASDLSGGLDSGQLRANLGDAVDGLDIDTSRLGDLNNALARADAFGDSGSPSRPTGGTTSSPTGTATDSPSYTPTSYNSSSTPSGTGGTGDTPGSTNADAPAPSRGGDGTPTPDTGDSGAGSRGTDTPAVVHSDAPGADRSGSGDRTGDRDTADTAADLPTTEWIENQVSQFRSELDLAEVDGGIANRLAEDRQPALVHAGAPEARMEMGGHNSGGSSSHDLSPSAHHTDPGGSGGGGGSGPDGPGGGGGSGPGGGGPNGPHGPDGFHGSGGDGGRGGSGGSDGPHGPDGPDRGNGSGGQGDGRSDGGTSSNDGSGGQGDGRSDGGTSSNDGSGGQGDGRSDGDTSSNDGSDPDVEGAPGTPERVGKTLEELQQQGPLGDKFTPDVVEAPNDPFKPHEREIADLRAEEGRHVTGLPEDHSRHGEAHPDALERSGPDDPGQFVEYKTLEGESWRSVDKTVRKALKKFSEDSYDTIIDSGDIVLDGRKTVSFDNALQGVENRLRQELQKNSSKLDRVGNIDVYTKDGHKLTYRDGVIYKDGEAFKKWENGRWVEL